MTKEDMDRLELCRKIAGAKPPKQKTHTKLVCPGCEMGRSAGNRKYTCVMVGCDKLRKAVRV